MSLILGLLMNKWVAIALAIAAGLFALHQWDVRKIEVANEKKFAQQKAARASEIDAGKTAIAAVAKLYNDEAATRQAERAKFDAVIKTERGKNVTKYAVDSCRLTAGVIVQHNLSADGRAAVPADPRIAVDRPAGVGIDQFAATVDNNYSRCHENADQLRAWQRWAVGTCRAWNKRWGKTEACPNFPTPIIAAIAGQPKSAFGAEKGK